MKCPQCGYEYVRNVGRKVKIPQYDAKGSHQFADPRVKVENEKKYHCKRCGWKS